MALLYEEIMKVPGLTGSWKDRNEQLYYKLGAPLGAYKGNLQQNLMLLNNIRDNNFYKSGLPGSTPQTAAETTDPREAIANAQLENAVVPKPFSEVMPQETWNSTFDEWTRDFANKYMEPEWREQTYDPTVQANMRALDVMNRQAGAGGGRSMDVANNLGQAANEAAMQEKNLRQQYQDSLAGLRTDVLSNWATPLYESQLKRYTDSPWSGVDLGTMTANDNINLGEIIGGVPGGQNLNQVMDNLASWTPGTSNAPTTSYDWSVAGTNPNVFNQYQIGNQKIGSGIADQYAV